MNGWERHGIKHLSASHCNLWGEHPGLCILRYIGGIKDEDSPAAWRGKAVEDALTALLHGTHLNEAIWIAENTFRTNAQGEESEEIIRQFRLVVPMCNQLQEISFDRGLLVGTQVKIEHWLDGVPIPFIGYIDFNFDKWLDDLKTTTKIPRQGPRPDHVRQVALYSAAKNKPARIIYVSAKDHEIYKVDADACAKALDELREFALSEERFLARVDSAQDALRCLPFNSDYWKVNESTLAAHKKLLEAVQ